MTLTARHAGMHVWHSPMKHLLRGIALSNAAAGLDLENNSRFCPQVEFLDMLECLETHAAKDK